jgi:hypothetical protein
MWERLLKVFYEHTAVGTGAGSRGTQRSSHLQRHRSGTCARDKKNNIKDDCFRSFFLTILEVFGQIFLPALRSFLLVSPVTNFQLTCTFSALFTDFRSFRSNFFYLRFEVFFYFHQLLIFD